MGFHVLIPARLSSTRLPAKPLADLGGAPMVVRVAYWRSWVGRYITTGCEARWPRWVLGECNVPIEYCCHHVDIYWLLGARISWTGVFLHIPARG